LKPRLTTSDDELLATCRAGDGDAWRRLVERYQDMVFSVARRIAGAAAEDAAQETFLRVFRKLHTYRGDTGKFSSWLYRVAYNVSCDVATARGPVAEFTPAYDAQDGAAGPEELVASAEYARLARGALASLRPDQRHAVELYYLFHRSYADVATIMALPVGTVKSHIHRGKRAILAALAARGVARELAEEM
jgi:RNA polymerase sigma-70 factor (ECF subfamily)